MLARFAFLTLPALAVLTQVASAQPPVHRVFAPPPSASQGLGSLSSPIVPRPLGYHVAPYGGLGYGPLGDRTGYPGSIYSNYYGSYRTPPALPPLILETPGSMPLRPGKLPTIVELFPGTPEPIDPPRRMPDPVPPGPVVPVSETKDEGK